MKTIERLVLLTAVAADKKLIGPSWKEIAAKGGKLPMAPVDAVKISDADLKTVLSWVLKTPS